MTERGAIIDQLSAEDLREMLVGCEAMRRDLRQRLFLLEPESEPDQTTDALADWVSEAESPLERLKGLVAELERREALPPGHAFFLPVSERVVVHDLSVSRIWGRYDEVGARASYADAGGGAFTARVDRDQADRVRDLFRAARSFTIVDREAPAMPMEVVISEVGLDAGPGWMEFRSPGWMEFRGHVVRWPESPSSWSMSAKVTPVHGEWLDQVFRALFPREGPKKK